MSRSALVVAGALFAIGVLVWLFARETRVAETPAPARVTRPPAPVAPAPRLAAPASDVVPSADRPATGKPRITTREELARALTARGLDADRLIAGYRDWRIARGYLDADPLAGITAENAPSRTYLAMDRETQKALADAGDLGALQAYAAGSLPNDPFTAIESFGRASRMGSAAAMGEIATIFATSPVEALRGGNPGRDLRQDAAAWALAAIRQHGPVAATPGNLAAAGYLTDDTDDTDPAVTAVACGRSLAILADVSAASPVRDDPLPPVFVTEPDVYERLPCRDTPAPVMPPRALENCSSTPATGANNRPIELWICEET